LRSRDGYDKVAHLYDLFDDKPNIDFFLKYASSAGRLIDIGAGTGRIAIPLARRGLDVTCIEPSPGMRSVFEAKIAREPDLPGIIRIVASHAADFRLGRTFPLAIMSGCFDHFLDDDERAASLANIAAHLVPGGRLLFDSFPGLMRQSPLKAAGEAAVDETVYKRLVGGRILPGAVKDTELVYEAYVGGRLIDRIAVHSLVGITSRRHILDLVAAAGFEVINEFGDYRSTPYEDQEVLVIEALKTP
jgi:SAM-dependent methyltransferase